MDYTCTVSFGENIVNLEYDSVNHDVFDLQFEQVDIDELHTLCLQLAEKGKTLKQFLADKAYEVFADDPDAQYELSSEGQASSKRFADYQEGRYYD